MRYILLVFFISGSIYCIWKMLAIIYDFMRYYRMFKNISATFNVQYQILREYIKSEMSSEDIIERITINNPEDLKFVALKNQITILFVKGSCIQCTNSAEIRNAFLKSGTLLEKLKEYFQLHNLSFVEKIYNQNQEFFEELKRVRKSKGESTELNIEEELQKIQKEEQ